MALGSPPEYCSVCFAPLERDADERLLPCWAHKYWIILDDLLPITYLTHSPARRIGNDIKYCKQAAERQHIPYIAGVLYRYLGNNFDVIRAVWQPSMITYVPCHTEKIATRGFDLMADVVNYYGAIRDRIGIRPALVQLCADEQPSMGRVPSPDSWGVLPGVNVRGADVMVIDDVVTSGATLAGIAMMLRRNGARHVYGLAIARAIKSAPEQKIMSDLASNQFDWTSCRLRAQARTQVG